jgi:hypothetical protein
MFNLKNYMGWKIVSVKLFTLEKKIELQNYIHLIIPFAHGVTFIGKLHYI